MLKIHHVPLTRSFRVVWLCEELDLPYEAIPTDFSQAYRASAEWRALNPVGKVPVLLDDELVMFESGAMVQHILNRYAQGQLCLLYTSPSPRDRTRSRMPSSA